MAFQQHSYVQLQKRLTRLGFDRWDVVRAADVVGGAVFPFAEFFRFIFLQAAPAATKALMQRHAWFVVDLAASGDASLCGNALRLLRTEFAHRPPITDEQFLRPGQFAGAKVAVTLELLSCMLRMEGRLAAEAEADAAAGAAAAARRRRDSLSASTVSSRGHASLVAASAVGRSFAASDATGATAASGNAGGGGERAATVPAAVELAALAAEKERLERAMALLEQQRRALNRVERAPRDA